MKTMKVLVLVSMSLGLGFGCATDEPLDGSLDPVEVSAEDLSEESFALGQLTEGAPCHANYHCQLGTRCNLLYPYPGGGGQLWTCKSFAVFGPAANPCIDTPQCQAQYNLNSFCYYRNPGSSYGECIIQ